MFRRNLFHVCYAGIVILPCMILVGLQGCGSDDDEGADGETPCEGTPSRQRIVFITLDTFLPNFASSADWYCEFRAHLCGLTGSYKAWLSDSYGSPSTRFTRDGEFVLVDETKVASCWADLTDGRISASLRLSCDGTYVEGGTAWTGTSDDGTKAPAYQPGDGTCSNWTSTAFEQFGVVGGTASSPITWSNWSAAPIEDPCDRMNHLFCFEQ